MLCNSILKSEVMTKYRKVALLAFPCLAAFIHKTQGLLFLPPVRMTEMSFWQRNKAQTSWIIRVESYFLLSARTNSTYGYFPTVHISFMITTEWLRIMYYVLFSVVRHPIPIPRVSQAVHERWAYPVLQTNVDNLIPGPIMLFMSVAYYCSRFCG